MICKIKPYLYISIFLFKIKVCADLDLIYGGFDSKGLRQWRGHAAIFRPGFILKNLFFCDAAPRNQNSEIRLSETWLRGIPPGLREFESSRVPMDRVSQNGPASPLHLVRRPANGLFAQEKSLSAFSRT